MNVIEKAKAHFKEQLDNGPKEIDVPEWDTKIYVYPMTGLQRDAIFKYMDKGEYSSANIEMLIQRARDADGNKMFSPGHRQILLRQVDQNVIDRIAGEMGTFEMDLEGDAEKVGVKNS